MRKPKHIDTEAIVESVSKNKFVLDGIVVPALITRPKTKPSPSPRARRGEDKKLRKLPEPRDPDDIKFTTETTEKICAAIRMGNYLDTSCAYAGVSYELVQYWLRQGNRKDGYPKYKEFAEKMAQSLAYAEINSVSKISKAGETSWQAEAWRLERRFPEKWAKREYTENKHKIEILDKEHMDRILHEDLEQLVDANDEIDSESDTDAQTEKTD